MSDVRDFTGPLHERARRLRGSVDSGGGPPHDDDMEERVKKLEATAEKTLERLVAIERDVAVMRGNYATKEDLHREINAQTWKLVTFVCGFGTALVGATYFVATHIK
ncbi:hypothetical protein [Pseudoduganella chitinolytica]|uniref:DUF1640 domain-containing protein n=1 Tax=Pseudoduganella chitinolytica TaxID=34070 RepID=A0ABY8BG64_9BURK|nr:hypothetical protein [Pseudoduganella chitinolytica]WEF34895.1 hypothetical protein PX653_09085 [Pseudoduganella chitinolytica]